MSGTFAMRPGIVDGADAQNADPQANDPTFPGIHDSATASPGLTFSGYSSGGDAAIIPTAGNDDVAAPGETTEHIGGASGGLQFNITYDSSVNQAPAGFKGAVAAACQFYSAEFSDPITLNIHFGYGEVNGHSINSGNLAQSAFTNGTFYTYAQLKSALAADATSADDQTALASLPATDPTNGGRFLLTSAEQKALGLLAGNGTSVDGYVGLSNVDPFTFDPNNRAVPGDFDAIGALEHEISEVMGRYGSLGQNFGNNVYEPLDLYRYSSPGVRDLVYGPGSFSIDGQNLLQQFNNPNNGGDPADWIPSLQGDAYGDGYKGVAGLVTPTDVSVMDILGYDVANAAPPAPTGLTLDTSTDSGVKGDNITNVTRPAIDGQGVAGDTVTLYDGTTAVGSGTVGGNSAWQIITSSLATGTHNLTATQTDVAGKTSGASTALAITIIPPDLAVLDTSNNQVIGAVATPYSGPVAGLQQQYINTGSDNVNVSVSSSNWFIHTGSGEDAIQMLGGTNVLDGGPGSNFLYGGNGQDGGTDTFFVDDRALTAPVYSTMVNFHKGDAATIFGIGPSGFDFQWADNEGAPGFTGLTLHVFNQSQGDSPQTEASLTLPGYGLIDLPGSIPGASPRLTVEFGKETDGTPYLYLLGNG